jgi:hypothetical protein
MFVWVICARDLSAVSKTELERICWSKQNLKYRRSVPYGAHRAKLRVIDGVLKLVQQFRPFMVVEAEIETSGLFPSTYHFRVCEFQDV